MNIPMSYMDEDTEDARADGFWSGVLSSLIVIGAIGGTLAAMYYCW